MESKPGSDQKIKMLTLLGIPPEILCKVASYTGRKDLSQLRLTCRALRDASYDAFVLAFISERHHVDTAASLATLIDITASPTFGRHVRTIIINTASHIPFELDFFGLRSGPSIQTMDQMRQIFKNIAAHGQAITIGVSSKDDAYGMRDLQASAQHDIVHVYSFLLQSFIWDARLAGCVINGIKVDLDQNFNRQTIDIDYDLAKTLSRDIGELSLYYHFMSEEVEYLPSDGTLRLECWQLHPPRPPMTLPGSVPKTIPDMIADGSMRFRISRLHVIHCNFQGPGVLSRLVDAQKQHLTHITLDYVCLQIPYNSADPSFSNQRTGRWSFWGNILHFFAELPALEYVKLRGLSCDIVGDRSFDRPESVWLKKGGIDEVEIQGGNFTQDLMDLAAWVTKEDDCNIEFWQNPMSDLSLEDESDEEDVYEDNYDQTDSQPGTPERPDEN